MAALAEEFMGVTEARTELSARLKRLQNGQLERVVLMRQNSPVAVIVSLEDYDRIRNAEDMREWIEDALAVLAARQADDGSRVSLDDLKAEFGID